jgi:hypothetical protein
MLFPSSRPHRIPPSTTDSQYDTATGYSSSSYTKRPRSGPKSDYYAGRNSLSANNSISRQYQSGRRRNNYGTEPLSDILNYQYSRPQQQQPPVYSPISPQRPTINYLIP